MRPILAIGCIVALLLPGACADDDGGAEPARRGLFAAHPGAREGDAFEGTSEQGASGPVRRGSFLSVALVPLRNVTDVPIRVLGAQTVWTEPGVRVRSFGVSPPGAAVSGTATDVHVTAAKPFSATGLIEPSTGPDDIHLVSFEASLEPPATEGAILGVDVFYEQGDDVRWQRWPLVIVLCEWVEQDPGCDTYRGRQPMDLDFETLLAEVAASR